MSCYNWCSGTIKIPTKEWSSFRKALIQEHNSRNDSAFSIARTIHTQIKEDSKYKRNYDYYGAAFDKIYNEYEDKLTESHRRLIMSSLVSYKNGSYKLHLPKKKDFPKATLKTTDYGYFTLEHSSKSISYNVEEGNRAVEHAQRDLFVRFVFNKLNSITWTRNSGGTIVGNDEYNRDSDYEGGGGNYAVYRFGPTKQKTLQLFHFADTYRF